MVTRWSVLVVAVLVAISPAVCQDQPGDEKTEPEIREFNLWLDDETNKSTAEPDDSNGRPLLRIDIEGLPGPDLDRPEPDVPDIEMPEVDDADATGVPEVGRPARISKEDLELIAQLRRDVRSMRREMSRLRAQVEEMAVKMAEAEALAAEPVVEPDTLAEAEKEPFYPFWLPQP